MEMNKYQEIALTTAMYPQENNIDLYYLTMGLCSEAGEIAGKVSKIIRDHQCTINNEEMVNLWHEMGDVYWFLANMCEVMGTTLDHIAQINIEKLSSRKERGVLKGNGDKR